MTNIILDNKDIIKTKDVTELGFNRAILQKMVYENQITRVSRGIYIKNDSLEDEMYLLHLKYPKGIFSVDTALFLHNLTDRTPQKFSITFPQGYNAPSLKNENVIIKRCVSRIYSLGLTTIDTSFGNPVPAYDVERTLCDIVKGKGSDIQLIKEAMLRYAKSSQRDMLKLMKYAEQLHVTNKIQRYMEVLL